MDSKWQQTGKEQYKDSIQEECGASAGLVGVPSENGFQSTLSCGREEPKKFSDLLKGFAETAPQTSPLAISNRDAVLGALSAEDKARIQEEAQAVLEKFQRLDESQLRSHVIGMVTVANGETKQTTSKLVGDFVDKKVRKLIRLLKRALNNLSKEQITKWTGWWMPPRDQYTGVWLRDPNTGELVNGRQRAMRKDVADNIFTVFRHLLKCVNIESGEVFTTVYQTAHACDMVTVSEAGNVSVSQAARVVELMAKQGLLICEQCKWDPVFKEMIPKFMKVTPLFWELVGVTEEEREHAIKQRKAFLQTQGKKEQISFKELIWNKIKQRWAAKKQLQLSRSKSTKSFAELRQEILSQIIKSVSPEELITLGSSGLTKLLNHYLGVFTPSHTPPLRS